MNTVTAESIAVPGFQAQTDGKVGIATLTGQPFDLALQVLQQALSLLPLAGDPFTVVAQLVTFGLQRTLNASVN